MESSTDLPLERTWLTALERRHLAAFTRQEFTRAVRALSVRYVERRQQLPDRSPLDSAGKRAAFGLFYAPLHYFTMQTVLRHLAPPNRVTAIHDLGCGTGVCGAAWAQALSPAPEVIGVDANAWAVAEARWNWKTLGLHGRASRGDLVESAQRLSHLPDQALRTTALLAGWAINELPAARRDRLLDIVDPLVARGLTVLIVEPLARGVSPWWPQWADRLAVSGVTATDLKFALHLPSPLDGFSESAGFRKREAGVRVMTSLPLAPSTE